MTCAEIADFLLEYQEGELAEVDRLCFEAHLAECPECVEYIRTYNEAVAAGRAACAGDCEVPERLVRAILAARNGAGPTASNESHTERR
jgi:anti-sigma factor RsiW